VIRVRQAIPFGKYLLLDRISVGGMAEVFRAKSYGVEGFEKVIAIKRILPSMGEDRDFIKMFIDEAKIAGQLAHANICQIFELGRIDGAHFIAMEFIWGKDLLQIQNRLRKLKQNMTPAMACFVVGKVCEGLDYAHRRRDPMGRPLEIVHRDCSPQNVIISYEGECKIIDFGIAKAASRSSRTMHGVLKGKFGYMSPEQVRGLPLDRRSDIFALGTILYECLTGERLFQGDTDFATLEKVRNVDIAPPRQLNPSIPTEVERIIMKSLARDVENRYQWCSEFLADLQAFLMAQPAVFTAKSLSAWMKDGFSPELEKERAQLESYKKMGREGLIAGVPAAQAKLDVTEHLGPAGQSEDPTILGGPSFEDMANADATQISQISEISQFQEVEPSNAAPLPAVAGEVAAREADDDRDFAEEGPTTIFGDEVDDNAPTLSPQNGIVPVLPAPVGRSTHQSAAVPPPRPPTVPMGGAPAPSAAPAARTLYGMAPPPVVHQPAVGFPSGTAPGRPGAGPPPPQPAYVANQQAYANQPGGYAQQQPGTLAPNDPTVMGLDGSQLPVDQLVAQAQAELARYNAQQQAAHGQQLPLQPGPPSGLYPGYQQQQHGQQPPPQWQPYHQQHPGQPGYPGYDPMQGQGSNQPVFTPSGVLISPPTNGQGAMVATAVGKPEKRRRPSLGKDIAIGVGIAAVVLGLVAIVKFAVLGDEGGARRAEAAATSGSIVITVPDGDKAEVFIGEESRGVVTGTLTVENIAPGPQEIKVVRDGVDPCTRTVELDAGETENVECAFAKKVAAPEPDPTPTATPDAGVAAVAPPPAPIDAAPAPVVAPDASAAAVVKPEIKSDESKKDDEKVTDEQKLAREERKRKREEEKKLAAEKKAQEEEEKRLAAEKKAEEKKKKEEEKKRLAAEKKAKTGTGTGSGSGAVKTTKSDDPNGYLVAYTTPWAKVSIDGRDTGKMTPIAPRAKIALPPGKHKVTFVVGRESWSYTVTIKAGETSKITKDLPVTSQ
jgi:eukaryotic-like serine/threonine-protein kinase